MLSGIGVVHFCHLTGSGCHESVAEERGGNAVAKVVVYLVAERSERSSGPEENFMLWKKKTTGSPTNKADWYDMKCEEEEFARVQGKNYG